MQKHRTIALVCQHGVPYQNCSICQPRRSQEELRRALGESVDTARPRLLRLARLNGIGPDEAEDVVQETYLEAWRHLEKLQPERLSAWLDGICRNVCKRHLHAQGSMPHMSELPEDLDEELLDPRTLDPLEDLGRQDMQVLLDRALSHLSASAREVIELCYLAELPQREVAQRLFLNLGALELKLHRARRQLHQILYGELCQEAREAGLRLDEDEAMGWQETRQWCFVCGRRRLRGIVEPKKGGGASLRLRCPECSPRYHIDLTHTENFPDNFGPIRSFRSALKRILQADSTFTQNCLSQRQCPVCHSPLHIQTIDRRTLVSPSGPYDVLPLGIYVHMDCLSCGLNHCCEVYVPALRNPVLRDFLLRPRVQYKPASFTTYEGSNAICFGLLDLSSTETLTAMVHPQTLDVLALLKQ
ncbi:RNA polymerase sigma factor [Reticulibacter mediterranei]|nr:sigma-70 family RNA polymerase sigma factor [Reticulibacter mediterranei]